MIFSQKNKIGDIRIPRSPFGRSNPQPLFWIGDFYYINDMKKQLNDLEDRIENLNKMLVSAIRYGEEDIQRMIRYKIEGLEREMKILKNKMS